MSLKDRIIRKAGRAQSRIQPRVQPGARLFLLKRESHSARLATIAEITSAYFVKWSEYRGQMRFQLADDDAAREDQFAQLSYIAYGVPNGADEIDVFAVSAEQHDRVPPSGANPFWKLFGVRVVNERFTVA